MTIFFISSLTNYELDSRLNILIRIKIIYASKMTYKIYKCKLFPRNQIRKCLELNTNDYPTLLKMQIIRRHRYAQIGAQW